MSSLSPFIAGLGGDFLQNVRLDDLESVSRSAGGLAILGRTQTGRLAELAEGRLREVERDNAVLGLLVLQLIRMLHEKAPEQMEAKLAEIRTLLESSPAGPRGIDFLREALKLPAAGTRPPLVEYAKPVSRPPSVPRPGPPPRRPR